MLSFSLFNLIISHIFGVSGHRHRHDGNGIEACTYSDGRGDGHGDWRSKSLPYATSILGFCRLSPWHGRSRKYLQQDIVSPAVGDLEKRTECCQTENFHLSSASFNYISHTRMQLLLSVNKDLEVAFLSSPSRTGGNDGGLHRPHHSMLSL